jgi:biofilm PGA synthesis N-glycosyltransferase PgaC
MTYVLITPARNEQDFIELTIKAVVSQSLRPVRWIIVSDGSTDATDDIVKKYAAQHDWIELHRMPPRSQRDFGGKARCFNSGYERLAGVKFDLVGNLDADITFDADYYRFLVSRFDANSALGIGGTPFTEGDESYDFRFSSIEHVSGACQMFRRQCYEAIGGYRPLKCGGIDVVAVLTARMKGWQTRTFPEKTCVHHRTMGTATASYFSANFRLGQKDYLLGRHPIWQIFRSIYQMKHKPLLIGGSTLLLGYLWAALKRTQRPVSRELIEFQRTEQMQRLRKFLCSVIGTGERPQNVKVSS